MRCPWRSPICGARDHARVSGEGTPGRALAGARRPKPLPRSEDSLQRGPDQDESLLDEERGRGRGRPTEARVSGGATTSRHGRHTELAAERPRCGARRGGAHDPALRVCSLILTNLGREHGSARAISRHQGAETRHTTRREAGGRLVRSSILNPTRAGDHTQRARRSVVVLSLLPHQERLSNSEEQLTMYGRTSVNFG